MVSNEEIKFKLKYIRDGANSEEVQRLLETEIPYKWVDGACLFDFGSIPVEDLSIYIKSLFEWWGYNLEEGTPVDGIYGYGSALKFLSSGLLLSSGGLVSGLTGMRYRFKVEIFLSDGETYLKIYKAIKGVLKGIYYGFTGIMILDKEFNRIINEIKYIHPPLEGYLVCNKCGGYYKIQPGEYPEDFTDKCECGGRLKYVEKTDFENE